MKAEPTPARTALSWFDVSGHDGLGNTTDVSLDTSPSIPVVARIQVRRSGGGAEESCAAPGRPAAAHTKSTARIRRIRCNTFPVRSCCYAVGALAVPAENKS